MSKELTFNKNNDDVTKLIIETTPNELIKIDTTKANLEIIIRKEVSVNLLFYLDDKDYISKHKVTINIDASSSVKLYNAVFTSKDVTVYEECNLLGINASVDVISVFLSSINSNFTNNIYINHLVKATSSNLETYAIANDQAKIILDNNATIKKGSIKAVAHQKAKGLTLTANASIKALPNLYIDEYDVIANHAASIGSLNPDDLFYLMSRGLTKEEASKIMIQGFIIPLIDKISDEQSKKLILDGFINKTIV